MKKAIAYIRVSTTNQDMNRQIIKVKEYCIQNNYILEEKNIIKDFGKSGASANREGYLRLQSMTNEHGDIVIVSELSRLSRETEVLETVSKIQNIVYNGLSLVFLDRPNKIYEADQPLKIEELIGLLVGAWQAAQERIEIKRKNQEGKMALLQNNPYAVVDYKIPYGFKAIYNPNGNRPKKIMIPVPEEIANIKKLFELVNSGKTLRQCAKYFNDRNITFKGYYATGAILSNYIHSEVYIGIRRRKQRFGREENPREIVVKIDPIISEEDFYKAQELVKTNTLYVSRGTVNYNPLKGIIKCRCGRAMTVKDKKPTKGISKYTYRCSCTENKTHPNYCSYNIDEISFDLTNEVMYGLLRSMYSKEYSTLFREQSDSKIIELEEEMQGISSRILQLEKERKSTDEERTANTQKFIITTNPMLLTAIQEKQNELDKKIAEYEKNISKLKRTRSNKEKEIERLKDQKSQEKLSNLTIEEKGDLFHKYIKRITYIPVTLMQGFYMITFHNDIELIIAIRKTKSKQLASILPDKWTINEDTKLITAIYNTSEPVSMKHFSFATKTVIKEITIQEYLNSELAELRALLVDYSYRKTYLDKLHTAGIEPHRLTTKSNNEQ